MERRSHKRPDMHGLGSLMFDHRLDLALVILWRRLQHDSVADRVLAHGGTLPASFQRPSSHEGRHLLKPTVMSPNPSLAPPPLPPQNNMSAQLSRMNDAQIHQPGHAHDNRGPASFGFVVAFTAVAAIAVSLRLYVRLWIVRSPGWDDVAIVISLVRPYPPLLHHLFFYTHLPRTSKEYAIAKKPASTDKNKQILAIASATCSGLAISHGYGRHIRSIPPANIIAMIKWNVVGVATFYLGLLFSKVSVSLLLLRIVGRARTRYTTGFLWSMIAVAATIAVVATGSMLGEYGPVGKQWDEPRKVAGYGDLSVKIGIMQGGECLSSPPNFFLSSSPPC